MRHGCNTLGHVQVIKQAGNTGEQEVKRPETIQDVSFKIKQEMQDKKHENVTFSILQETEC